MKSSSSVGPRGEGRSEFWLSAIGTPRLVVRVSCAPPTSWCSSSPLPRVSRAAVAGFALLFVAAVLAGGDVVLRDFEREAMTTLRQAGVRCWGCGREFGVADRVSYAK